LLAEGRVIDSHDLPLPLLEADAPADMPGDDLHQVLAACGGNMALAARRLGVNRSTVLRRLRALE
ncbi:helix-turn-helix domain-containing protein, partial [Paracoccus sp. PAMC 22219]|uniref:helix-turn-helix domain-containing protein n=1 Tax=Paracoccus sp. PAMC 22219 TaxID=1569209 RepID=UPI0005AAF872